MASTPQLSSALLTSLEEKIRTGDLRTGDRLPSEMDLVKSFGVSRSVVREALQNLKTRGLIQSQRGSGSYVSLTPASTIGNSISWYASLRQEGLHFVELLDLRMLVETEAARRVASGNASLVAIEKQLRIMQNSLAHPKRYADADIGFHLAIIKTSQHTLFYEVVHGLLSASGRNFARSTHLIDPSRLERVTEEHCQIFSAIQDRNPANAAKLMLSHLRHSRENLMRRIAAAKHTERVKNKTDS